MVPGTARQSAFRDTTQNLVEQRQSVLRSNCLTRKPPTTRAVRSAAYWSTQRPNLRSGQGRYLQRRAAHERAETG